MFVLDTNTLLSAIFRPGKLGKKTNHIIRTSKNISYSSLSSAELTIKNMLGKLTLKAPIHAILHGIQFQELPFDNRVSAELYSLPGLVRHEPFERMILATARAHGAKLITSDRKMLELGFEWILDSSI